MTENICSEVSILFKDTESFQHYNDVLMKVYTIEAEKLLDSICSELKTFIHADFSMTSYYESNEPGVCRFINCTSQEMDRDLFELYENIYRHMDYCQWYARENRQRVFRSTDIVSEKTIERSRIHNEWHSRLLNERGECMFYSVIMCIVANNNYYGFICFLRSRESGDFSDEEIIMLANMNTHLCERLGTTFPNGMNQLMLDKSINPIYSKYRLTDREFEVVCLLRKGVSREEIAKHMIISHNTVKKHIANIYRKLGVNNMEGFYTVVNNTD